MSNDSNLMQTPPYDYIQEGLRYIYDEIMRELSKRNDTKPEGGAHK
jgi:hypothetical protein